MTDAGPYAFDGDTITYHGPAASVAVPYDERTEIVTREVWAHNCYRFDDLTGRTVIDIGANVGATTLAAIAHGASRVVAVEPDLLNLELLHRNIGRVDDASADDIAGRVEIHCAAVGPYGSARVHRPPGHARGCCGSTWTTSVAEPYAGTISQRPLEEFLDGTDLWLKIDVEGAEYEILDSINIDALAARVEQLVLEWHHFPDRCVDAHAQLPDLVAHLQRRYDLELVGPPDHGLLFGRRR